MMKIQRIGDEALDARTKQLISLGVALFARNEENTYRYVQEAKGLGASDEQIMETVQAAAAAAKGQVLSYGAAWVQDALRGVRLKASPLPDEPSRAVFDPLGHLQYNAFQDTEFGQDDVGFGLSETNVSPSF